MSLFNDKNLDAAFSNRQFLTRELDYDTMTPILAYAAVGGAGSTMMESAYDEGYGKASFIGINPLATFSARGTDVHIDFAGNIVNHSIDPYLLLPEFTVGRKSFGFVTYDGVRVKEKLPDRHHPKAVPDFFFRIYKTVISFDHQAQKLVIKHEGSEEELNQVVQKLFSINGLPVTHPQKMIALEPDVSDSEFADKVKRAKEYIRQGDIFQVVLSRTFSADINISSFALYRALRKLNPTPYLFLFEEADFSIIGASPELLVGVKDGVIETVPIAGTCKKGDDINKLLNDPKETSEHIMLVDLARNDVGAMAKPGTVSVTKFKNVKTYSHVSHIVSHVVGQMDSKYNSFDVLKSVLPAGTLSGAPKIRAMEIIDELEATRRGAYGGAVMIVDESGNLTSAITIRTIFKHGSTVEVRTGAGIVYDSVPEKEVEETYLKARGAMASIELALKGTL